MSIIKSNGAGSGASGTFYDFEVQNSLLFNGSGGLRINSGEANTSYWTLSFWIKRHKLGGNYCTVMSAMNYASTYSLDVIGFGSANTMLSIRGSNANAFTSNFGSAIVRDTTAWYHICLRNNNGTVTRWLNGVQDSQYSISGTGTRIGRSGNHDIGAYGGSSEDYNNNFSLAEFYFINDSGFNNDNNYDYSQFAEFKNGVFVPKENTLTAAQIGDGGWYYEFKQTGDNADASGVGADSSGNNHHASIIGTVSAHCRATIDTPTNNFCRLNNIGRRYGQSYVGTFTQGNLKVASGGNATNVFGTMAINQIASQGGVYFEVRMDSLDTSRTYFGVVGEDGANNKNVSANSGGYTFPIKGMLNDDPNAYFVTDTDSSGSLNLNTNTAFSNGDVAGIAILSDGKFFAHRNGTYLNDVNGNTGNPSTGANPIGTIDLTLGNWVPYLGYASSYSANFGQDGTFQGNETSGGNQDGNGIGDFMFAVPTNCFALCTSNMGEPTIGSNSSTQATDHFNTVLWSGNSSTQDVVVGFQPDWVWLKVRNHTYFHELYDSSRGATKKLRSNNTSEEATQADGVTDFTASGGGFSLGAGAGGNESGKTYVAWNWKANGNNKTSFSESGNNPAGTHQANTTAGFSIVTYTGTGADGTIAHGLGAKPAWYFVKNRDVDTHNWIVWHREFATNGFISLNLEQDVKSASARFTSNEPTTSVFYVGSDGSTNADGEAFIAYVFAEVEGYNRFGSFHGNGSTDGPFVELNFSPAYVMIKSTATSSNGWYIYDNKRENYGTLVDAMIYANLSNAEDNGTRDLDFYSNGFKPRITDTNVNGSGTNYIYMAFAEAPFKYANAT